MNTEGPNHAICTDVPFFKKRKWHYSNCVKGRMVLGARIGFEMPTDPLTNFIL